MKLRCIDACLVLGMVVGLAPAVARAQTQAHIRFGAQWWDQSAREAKFLEFRDRPLGGFIEDFFLRNASGRNVVTLFGVNALQRDQSTQLAWSNGIRWRADVGYSQIPHRFGLLARSPYAQVGPGVFVLPDSLQNTNQQNPSDFVATMSDLLGASGRVPLEFRTDISTARLRARATRIGTSRCAANAGCARAPRPTAFRSGSAAPSSWVCPSSSA